MSKRCKACMCVAVIGCFLAMGSQALARGGWPDPPGGWDIIFDGNYPDLAAMQADGWYNGTGSGDPTTDGDPTTWDWDLTDTVFLTFPGEGEIENGAPSADAIVLQVRDNDTGGDGVVRRWKVGKPFPGTYDSVEEDILRTEGGVTMIARFRIRVEPPEYPYDEPDSANGERCYRTDTLFGFDGASSSATGTAGTAGLAIGPDAARWCRDDNTVSTNIETGDLTTTFRTFYAVVEPHPDPASADYLDNYSATLWIDGSVTPAHPKWWGPGDTGPDGTFDGVNDSTTQDWYTQSDRFAVGTYPELDGKAMGMFGPSRSGAMITVQYDYVCFKAGAFYPPTGPPSTPTLTAQNVGASVLLSWGDLANEESYEVERREDVTTSTFAQIATPAADATGYQDNTVAPGTTYIYRVRGVNSQGAGPWSNEVTITTRGALRARDWLLYDKR